MTRTIAKRFVFLCVMVAAAPGIILAGFGKGNHVVKGSLGGVMSANEFNEVEGIGPNLGVEYRFYLSDVYSLGVDFGASDYGENKANDDDEVDADVTALSAGVFGRIDFWPGNEVAPYASLGVTGNSVRKDYHESGGTRRDTTRSSGYFLGLGFDAQLKDNWLWGAELRSADAVGVSGNALALRASLSYRFGKVSVPATGLE